MDAKKAELARRLREKQLQEDSLAIVQALELYLNYWAIKKYLKILDRIDIMYEKV